MAAGALALSKDVCCCVGAPRSAQYRVRRAWACEALSAGRASRTDRRLAAADEAIRKPAKSQARRALSSSTLYAVGALSMRMSRRMGGIAGFNSHDR